MLPLGFGQPSNIPCEIRTIGKCSMWDFNDLQMLHFGIGIIFKTMQWCCNTRAATVVSCSDIGEATVVSCCDTGEATIGSCCDTREATVVSCCDTGWHTFFQPWPGNASQGLEKNVRAVWSLRNSIHVLTENQARPIFPRGGKMARDPGA